MDARFYRLSGSEFPAWVQTGRDKPLSAAFEHLMPATPWPLRLLAEIPSEWLKSDPGFPILVREALPKGSPPWLIAPERYTLRTPAADLTKPGIIICHHLSNCPRWHTLTEGLSQPPFWTAYGMPRLPDWPKELFLHPYELIQDLRRPLAWMHDLAPWGADTIGPVQLKLLHGRARWREPYRPAGLETQRRETFYGIWSIHL
jgi:hypothetical protein